MVTLLTNLFILLQNSGGKEMMAMLWAQQIMFRKEDLRAGTETLKG